MRSVQKRRLVIVSFVFLFVVLLAAFLLTFSSWTKSNVILDASVDSLSGKVAILSRGYEVKVYDVSGQLLSTSDMDKMDEAGGYAAIKYVNGRLYAGLFHTGVTIKIDSKGKLTAITNPPLDVNDRDAWDNGWDRNGHGMTYTTAKTVYQYNYPSFLRYLFGDREISFAITDIQTQETVVIWSFDENK